MIQPLRFGIVAGEKSGDMLGADLIKALKEHYPGAEFFGIGGPAMEELGCHSLVPMDRLSVMGFVEPLGRLPELLRIKRNLEHTFIENPPAVFIGIDSPDFNLRLEATLKANKIKTVQYVSPTVWAYRAKRIFKIKQAVDLMLTLFPFETEIYQKHGVSVACVGHPLANLIDFEDYRKQHREQLGLAYNDRVVALLPGSRSSEIKRLGPVFMEAAIGALQQFPKTKFVLPAAGAGAKILLNDLLGKFNILGNDQFQLVDNSQAAMSASNLVILASGTATLEAMLLRRPMVVCYKLAPITHAIASRMLQIPFVALPNLLAGKELVPEYVQKACSAKTLRWEITKFMSGASEDDLEHIKLLKEFDAIHRGLRLGGSVGAAQEIVNLIQTS